MGHFQIPNVLSATETWWKAASAAAGGNLIAPRGIPCWEAPGPQLHCIAPDYPLMRAHGRNLNYRFAAAEALWILSGSNRLSDLEPFDGLLAKYSDDGITMTGAYGPPVVDQLDYVVNTLDADPDSRQAVLTIWKPNPPPSKDIPCTITIVFQIRDNQLLTHVTMRSSDVFLGLPYDMFTFAMIGRFVCGRLEVLRAHKRSRSQLAPSLTVGPLTILAVSSHLYQSNLAKAQEILNQHGAVQLYISVDLGWSEIYNMLTNMRDVGLGFEGDTAHDKGVRT